MSNGLEQTPQQPDNTGPQKPASDGDLSLNTSSSAPSSEQIQEEELRQARAELDRACRAIVTICQEVKVSVESIDPRRNLNVIDKIGGHYKLNDTQDRLVRALVADSRKPAHERRETAQFMDAIGKLDQVLLQFPTGVKKESEEAKIIEESGILEVLSGSTFCKLSISMQTSDDDNLKIAGGNRIIKMILRNQAEAPSIGEPTLVGEIISAIHLDNLAARAHRNRIPLVQQALVHIITSHSRADQVHLMSLGIGEAPEWLGISGPLGRLPQNSLPKSIIWTGVDLVPGTLKDAELTIHRERNLEVGTSISSPVIVHPVLGNAFRMALLHDRCERLKKQFKLSTRDSLDHPVQQDFVYMAGLMDYVPENIARGIIGALLQHTKPGGLMLVTQVDAEIPYKTYLANVLSWRMFLRTSDQMADYARSFGYTIREDLCVRESTANAFKNLGPGEACITQDATGGNHFLWMKKPKNIIDFNQPV